MLERLKRLFAYPDQEAEFEKKEAEIEVVYPCGYKLCSNEQVEIVKEDDRDVVVFCREHNCLTTWGRGRPDLRRSPKAIRPDWSMDIHKIKK